MITHITTMQSSGTGKWTVICVIDGQVHSSVFAEEEKKSKFVKILTENVKTLSYEEVVTIKESIDSNEDHLTKMEAIRKEREKLQIVESILKDPPKGFISDGQSLYYNQESVSMLSIPKRLVDEIGRYIAEKKSLDPLINFWLQCAANPDPQAREDTFRFITDLNLKLTDAGQFLAYRNIDFKNAKPSKIEFYKKITHRYLEYYSKMESDDVQVDVYHAQGEISGIHVDVSDLFIDHDTDIYEIIANDIMADPEKRKKIFGDSVEESWDISVYHYLDTDDCKQRFGVITPEKYDNELDDDVIDDIELAYEDYLAAQEKESIKQFTAHLIEIIKVSGSISYSKEKYNLHDLYKTMILENEELDFTDAYTGKMHIRIGRSVSIPREECDSSNQRSCSRGLHIGSERFLKRNYFGGVGVMVLVSPRNVVSVPLEYGTGYKARVCDYIPIGFTEYDKNGHLIVPSNLDKISYRYAMEDMDQLLKSLEETPITELVRHKVFPENLSFITFAKTIEELRDSMAGKLVKL